MFDGLQLVMGIQLVAFFALRIIHEPAKARLDFELKEGGWFLRLMTAVAIGQVLTLIFAVMLPVHLSFADVALPVFVRWLGAGLGVLALGALAWVYRYLGENYHSVLHIQQGQSLVTEGPYRRIRHPLYTGLYLMFFAFSLQAANWLVFVLGIGGLTCLLWVRIPKEEALLTTQFGPAYRAYMQRTNRFMP